MTTFAFHYDIRGHHSPLALTQHPHHALDRSPHRRHLFLDD